MSSAKKASGCLTGFKVLVHHKPACSPVAAAVPVQKNSQVDVKEVTSTVYLAQASRKALPRTRNFYIQQPEGSCYSSEPSGAGTDTY